MPHCPPRPGRRSPEDHPNGRGPESPDATALRNACAESVAAALTDTADIGGFFTITVGGPDRGRHPVAADYARGVPDLITANTERYGTPEARIGASIMQLGHAARLWSPVLACTIVHGLVPDLTDLHRAEDGLALRLPAPGGRCRCRRDARPAWWRPEGADP
ncbi:hypothetical protein SAMN04489712_111121 [Thermomonospora echinospora]|uniref:Uncharacterized protein n=1 Tax=Thermomonospora echinospora TaxID=1992 RepID=A0A1H6CSU5_9ACTN|nr:hypothetical protein [Thermomonospora echinospora]SEG76090.1 hypothetical protein SAMN04489712_111121 [Thermomonospora echinospora]